TFALVLVISDVVAFVWGRENKTGPAAPGLAGSVRILGQLLPSYDLALIAFGLVAALGLWWLFQRTRWGVLIRAATQAREMVDALGVLWLPQFSLVMTFIVMAVVLIVRPWGLLGRPESQARGAAGDGGGGERALGWRWALAALVLLLVLPPLLSRFWVLVLVE